MSQPRIAIVIATFGRPVRLRWLLNALEEQTLEPELFEVIVVHDGDDVPETAKLLSTHPLTLAGMLRHVQVPGRGHPGEKRNVGWRLARAASVAFTDDDCRPPPDWLERALAASDAHPGAIVQGATRPDPVEVALIRAAPHSRSQRITPPSVWAQTCNIIYPRSVLAQLDGFDSMLPNAAGEDTDLALRAVAAGTEYVGEPNVLTYHAVIDSSLPQHLRSVWRWQHVAHTVKHHPELRSHLPLWIFWKRSHAWLPVAGAGVFLQRRHPAFGLLALPWLIHALPDHGAHPRGRIRTLMEAPSRAVVDLAEIAALVRGSVRYRTLLL